MRSLFLGALLALLCAESADAFCAVSGKLQMRPSARTGAASTAMSAEPRTRKALLEQGVLSLGALAAVSQPAAAAKYFGDNKDLYPEVIRPQDAVKDAGKLASDGVKQSISAIKDYTGPIRELTDTLEKDPQADISDKIKKTFNFAKLRTALNNVNDVFDEDTQRGTDRIIRNMIQDAIELGDAAKIKTGVARSPRKIEIMKKKLAKLDKAFSDILAFL